MTVGSFTSVSLEPPLIIISLDSESRTRRLVSASGAFAVSILAANQSGLSDRFAGRLDPEQDRFEGLKTGTLVTGSPLLDGALAGLDCRVRQEIPVGMNTLFLAEVVAAQWEWGRRTPALSQPEVRAFFAGIITTDARSLNGLA